MKKLTLRCLSIGLVLLAVVVFAEGAVAKKEVEIVVAGPWAIAPDPADSTHVVLVVINHSHKMHLLSGGDVWRWKDHNWGYQEKDSGYFAVSFSTYCSPHSNLNLSLYPIDHVDVKSRLDNSMSGTGIAISLPKPCWYEEGYVPSYVKLGDNLEEHSFTTITRLHYTVDDGLTELRFAGLAKPVQFKEVDTEHKIINPALSIVVGKISGGPDKNCDKHSADVLDRTLQFWGQAPVRRQFPMLDDNGSQLPGQYHGTCKTYATGVSVGSIVPNLSRPESQGGISRTANSLDRTKVILSPSRSDCHVSQFNINGTIP